MPLVPGTEQQLILLQVGDAPDNRLAANIAMLWTRNAGYASLGMGIQTLYTQRDALDVLIGYYQDQVDVTTFDMKMSAHQRLDTLQAMRLNTERELLRREQIARMRRGGASLPITTQEPIGPLDVTGQPNPGGFDANSITLSGSPYGRLRRSGV